MENIKSWIGGVLVVDCNGLLASLVSKMVHLDGVVAWVSIQIETRFYSRRTACARAPDILHRVNYILLTVYGRRRLAGGAESLREEMV